MLERGKLVLFAYGYDGIRGIGILFQLVTLLIRVVDVGLVELLGGQFQIDAHNLVY